jgi:hypothetical protein
MGIYLLSGLLAATLAWVINNFIVVRLGKVPIFSLIPMVEEGLKTGLALFFRGSIFYTHLTFGLAEAILDVLRPGRSQVPAGIMGIISHGIYGWITTRVYAFTGNLWMAWAMSIVLHGLWNAGVIFLAPAKRNRNSP